MLKTITMKIKFRLFSRLPLPLLVGALMSLLACGPGEVNVVDFTLNGRSIRSSATEPAAPNDTTQVLSVFTGDTLYIRDVSQPAENVEQRSWDTDGDGLGEAAYQDAKFFPVAFEEVGMQQIKLVVNEKAPGVSKWIMVNEIYQGPKITFIQPYAGETVGELNNTIESNIANVLFSEEVSLSINDREMGFDFDPESGDLRAEVRLFRGDNEVRLLAKNFEGEVEEIRVVTYAKASPTAVAAPPRPSTRPRPRSKAPAKPASPPPPPPAPQFKSAAATAAAASQYTKDCVDLYSRSTFSFNVRTKAQAVNLQSFKLYTNTCGRLIVTLSGPGLDEEFTASLNGGRSQISFGAIDPILRANSDYTISCKSTTGGGCTETTPARFENATECALSSRPSPYLTLTEPDGKFIYDLKFLYP